MSKKVGILGSGAVSKTLAAGFLKHGYEVMAGSRDPKKIEAWQEELGSDLKAGDFAETAAFGEILVLAIRGAVADEVLKAIPGSDLEGKIIMDATNPIAGPPEDGILPFFTDLQESLMEKLQKGFPSARFVKAFNSVGAARMVNPDFGGQKPSMFICGNDDAARAEVSAILDQFGWETEDMGSAAAARAIEPLCMLWCIPGFRENRWMHAFKILD
jgi:predicted dinucleotide-binding enzyme